MWIKCMKCGSHCYDNSNVILQAIFYKKYSVQSDVWSFGCVMYEIWSLGHKPFEDDDGRGVHNYVAILFYAK